MTLRLTILGCGSSGGVPRVGGQWGACDPSNPRNRRRRCAALVEKRGPRGRTTVLIDTSPDLREQLLDAGVDKVDGVLYTHDHADHTHGIDDLRALAYKQRDRVDVYYDQRTGQALQARFGYCFRTPRGSEYPPILRAHEFHAYQEFEITGTGGALTVMPFLQEHGPQPSIGFRIDGIAYSSDISGVPARTAPLLEGLDVWVVDALRPTPHPSHFSLPEALEQIARFHPRLAVLTHLHVDLDYDTLKRELSEGVVPAYDGMVIEMAAGAGVTAPRIIEEKS